MVWYKFLLKLAPIVKNGDLEKARSLFEEGGFLSQEKSLIEESLKKEEG